MSALLDLAERVLRAAGPDRELDRDIELTRPGVLPHPDGQRFDNDLGHREPYVISGAGHPDYEPGQGYIPSRYTASIDAAMTLVAEGWRFYVDNGTLDGANSHACVFQPGDGWNLSILQGGCRDAATPALALCAAALRARAAEQSALNREGGK